MHNGSYEKINLFVSMQEQHDIPDYEEYKSISSGVYSNVCTDYVDNIGDNINSYNKYYAEYSKFYWIWKNLKPEGIIGFCQYRRYFWLNHPDYSYLEKTFENIQDIKDKTNPANLKELLHDSDIIMTAPFCFPFETVEEQYCMASCQRACDWTLMRETLLKLYPEYEEDFDTFANSHWIYAVNMFITKSNIFNDYMEWIFNIFFHMSKEIKLPTDPYQYRVYAYLAERLINLFIIHKKLNIKRVPLLFKNGKTEQKAEFDTPISKKDSFITALSWIYCKYGVNTSIMPRKCKTLFETLTLNIKKFSETCESLYIYGAGTCGRIILRISEPLKIKCRGFIETVPSNSHMDGLPIISIDQIKHMENPSTGIIIAIKDRNIQNICLNALKNFTFKKICYFQLVEEDTYMI